MIYTLTIFLLSIIAIVLIINYGKGLYLGDVADINEQDVSFTYVFFSNLLLIIKMYVWGICTFGIYAVFSMLQNILGIGFIANQLFAEGYDCLAYKMIPHGIFEFLGMSLALGTVLWIWIKILRGIPDIIKRKTTISECLKNIVLTTIISFAVNSVIFGIAGIVEVLVSYIKVL